MVNKKKKLEEKEKKLKILKTIAIIFMVYLFVNLFLYGTARINHFTFWVSLIVIGILSWKVIPNIRRKIERSY